ncbi:MAG: FHA domain-containing protein, partial [Gammaproteobacteria bacterium]|nr:FHA domain-containing protein [Gammaproteobacteria bacterium]
ILGNNKDADINIPGDRVSKIHAVIEKDQFGSWRIVSKSEVGILVNKRSVEQASLNIGDLIQIGEVTLFKFDGKITKSSTNKETAAFQSAEKVKVKKPLLYILAFYLLLMLGVGIYLSIDFTKNTATGLSNEYVKNVLDSTKTYLSNLSPEKGTETINVMFDRNRDLSASYYNVKNSTNATVKASQIESLIAELEQSFFRAWKLEKTENYQEALDEYRKILNLVPDNQAVTTKVASWRINTLKDRKKKK